MTSWCPPGAAPWQPAGAPTAVWRFEGVLPAPGVLSCDREGGLRAEPWWHGRLQLVRGVGPHREASLKARGYRSLPDLSAHPVFGSRASAVVDLIERRDVGALRRCGAREAELTRLFGEGEAAVFDIETMGLAPLFPVIVAGFAWRQEGRWRFVQLVAPHFDDEPSLLVAVRQVASGFSALVTYNGRSFDIPFVEVRRAYHGLDRDGPWPDGPCLDLLGEARRCFGPVAGSARLAKVEALLLGGRPDDIPAPAIPQYYCRYVETGDPACIQAVVRHNRYDLRAVAAVWEACAFAREA